MQIELTCHPGITSCINEGPVAVDEIVYVYTVEGQFTDEEYPGWVRATVTEAWKDCGCWNYKLQLFEEDLPAGIANLSLCDIANIGCAELECPPCAALEAPQNLTATPTCLEDQLVLEWDEVEGRTGFEIQSSPSDDPFVWTEVLHLPLGSPELNAFALEGDNDTWWFRVRAYRETEDCPEEVSKWTQVSGMPAQHGFPTEFAAVAVSDEQIDLSWVDNASSETGFEIERSLDGETGWALVLTPSANATFDADDGLDPDTEYFYRIRAVGAGGTFSCWSEVVSATTEEETVPEAPSLLEAHAISDSEIDLTWQDNSDDETGFEIERSLDGIGGWTQVLTPAANATSDMDTGLDAETEYCYRIRAVNGVGPSAWSNVACDTTLAIPAGESVWVSRANPEDNSWRGAAYGDGMFVIVSFDGTNRVMSSPDGVTWTARTAAGTNGWRDVTWGNGLFVAVGDGPTNSVMTSPDGINWTAQTAPLAQQWYGVDYSDTLNLFVAVSFVAFGNPKVMTSPDGVTWTEQGPVGPSLIDVAWGDGLFVAVGTGDVVTSPDGITWTNRSAPINTLDSVAWGNGIWVAVTGTAGDKVMTSPDGITWTARASHNFDWNHVAFGNGMFVVVGGTGSSKRAMSSPNGINWTLENTPVDNSWLALVYGSNVDRFVAASVDGAGNRVMTREIDVPFTPDTWVSRTNPVDNQWAAVAPGTGLFVAVAISGTGDRVMTSPDGITWTARTSAADNEWRAIAYAKNLFVAVASSGTGDRVMTSPDGETWTIRTSAADNFWKGVAFGNGVFVAVAQDGTGDRVMTSPDGITWTSRNAAEENAWNGITYADSLGLFVAVASSGVTNRVMTSPDGETWTARAASHDIAWQSVAWNGSILVAVASNGNEDERVMTSPDGINWTQRVSPIASGFAVQWQHVAWGAGHFVAVGTTGSGDRVMSSPDGISWTIHNSAADNAWLGTAYKDGTFVAVAASGTGNRVMTASG